MPSSQDDELLDYGTNDYEELENELEKEREVGAGQAVAPKLGRALTSRVRRAKSALDHFRSRWKP